MERYGEAIAALTVADELDPANPQISDALKVALGAKARDGELFRYELLADSGGTGVSRTCTVRSEGGGLLLSYGDG